MSQYAFIFARGGSKGLPGKNIKLLGGKPLLTWSVDVAKEVSQIDRIFVSTEDDVIAEVARQAGAEVIPRPDDLAGDNTPEWLAWQHALDWVEQKYGCFDTFISLPATSPLRNAQDVENALQRLRHTRADICISVTDSERSPYFNMVKSTDSGLVELVIRPETGVVRRQDAPEVFDITTVVYVTTPVYIRSANGVMDGKVTSVWVPKARAIDIDTQFDFDFAEFLLEKRNNA